MRSALPASLAALALIVAPSAFADCVDFSKQRAEAAGAALARNAPTAAQLGVPSLDGLTLDGPLTTGDPKCSSRPGPPRRFVYNTGLSFGELVTRWHPYIKRRTEVDGMKREWFKNPYSGNGFVLTSGTRVEFVLGSGQQIVRLFVEPASAVAALTTESQPYGVSEIVDWSPWPGGAKGPRQFVRADQGDGAPAASPGAADAASGTPTPAASGAAKPVANVNCPPKPASGATDGARAGAEIGGAVLGGGFGRSIGNAVGGVLGSLGSPQGAPPADPNCP
jgi:hypothetical protein